MRVLVLHSHVVVFLNAHTFRCHITVDIVLLMYGYAYIYFEQHPKRAEAQAAALSKAELTAYITHARKKCCPKLSDEAAEVLILPANTHKPPCSDLARATFKALPTWLFCSNCICLHEMSHSLPCRGSWSTM